MTDEYTEKNTKDSASVQNYGRYTDTKLVTSVKTHECHCAPDAPCRISGRCTCMNSLLKKLEGAQNK